MNDIKDRVDAINARATRRTDAIIAAHLAGHLTEAEREQELDREHEVANIQVRQARQGQ
jgi:dTDP-4-amino-4,6-dideoxygalactose transaminase